ncbi:MAG: serine--tRNA ligase [Oligoflexia bacterium]|nr:serine--tRNA ligase [Oligoflexia bacterium]
MIDLNQLRTDPEPFVAACRKKRIKFDIPAFLKLDTEFRALKSSVEAQRSQQNAFSKELPKLKDPEKSQKLAQMKELAAKLKEAEGELKGLEERWLAGQLLIPSVPLDRVPEGKDDTENKEIRRWGEIPKFAFKAKDHVELGKQLDILDIERGVKVAGARSYFLKGDGTRLQHALMSLAMDHLHRRNFILMDPPHIVKHEMMVGTGYFPGGEESAYHLDQRDDGFHLIGTAEVPVTSYHAAEILPVAELPKRYAGYSPCYRREAGAYGKDTHGAYRVHQFYKVEQVIVCKAEPAESAAMHAELLGNAEALMQLLELPYRVVDVCSGDLGQGQVYKNDIEAWMPSRNAYGETHSCSTFYDFQARRLNLRYKDETGKNIFCHTLNNTLIASPRVLIPFLEVHQNADGSINIPQALRPYLGGQERISA